MPLCMQVVTMVGSVYEAKNPTVHSEAHLRLSWQRAWHLLLERIDTVDCRSLQVLNDGDISLCHT